MVVAANAQASNHVDGRKATNTQKQKKQSATQMMKKKRSLQIKNGQQSVDNHKASCVNNNAVRESKDSGCVE